MTRPMPELSTIHLPQRTPTSDRGFFPSSGALTTRLVDMAMKFCILYFADAREALMKALAE